MHYLNIYYKFLQYFQETTPLQRIEKRNKSDPRLMEPTIYTELHHIVPKSQGGTDDITNLIRLLPEEHIFIHYLRWKIFKDRNDLYAVNFMINGFFNKKYLSDITLNRCRRTSYSLIRRKFGEMIRIANKGSIAISDARRGKMPVKDVVTGEIIGSVVVDHPNIISGKWVHTSKGRKIDQKERNAVRNRVSGCKNPNYSGMTDGQYIIQTADYIKTLNDGRFIIKNYKKYCTDNNLRFIKHFSKTRFSGSKKKFIEDLRRYCKLQGIEMKYDQFYRGNR